MTMDDLEVARALKRLADLSVPPEIDPGREAALMAAFDAAQARRPARRPYWAMAGLAAAAAVLIAAVLVPARAGRHGQPAEGAGRDVQRDAVPGEFVIVPGAAALPPMESGSLVRMDVPVAMLPSLGLTPPAGSRTAVTADVVVGQDGLTRAVRLVD